MHVAYSLSKVTKEKTGLLSVGFNLIFWYLHWKKMQNFANGNRLRYTECLDPL